MDSAHETRWIIGVDVGGTKVAAGLVSERGELSQPIRVPMNPRGTAAEGFAAVTAVLDQLVNEIQRRYGIAARLDNDANAAALAEGLWGAGRGYGNVFYACLGTGIGTGVVLDGKIFHGRTGSAAEGGHVSIDYRGCSCNCGKRGCIEALASGTAIARRARE